MPKTSSGEKARFRAPASPVDSTSTPNNHNPESNFPDTQPQDLPPSYDVINPPIPSISLPSITTSNTPSFPVLSQNPLDAISRLTSIDLPKYCGVAQAKLSASHDILTTTKPELSTTQYALIRFLNEQASLPPKPLMLIQGSHTTSSGTTQIDFDLTLNLMSLLDIDGPNTVTASDPSSRLHVEPFEPSSSSTSSSPFKRSSRGNQAMTPLEQWAKKFIDEKTENKRYVSQATEGPLALLGQNLDC